MKPSKAALNGKLKAIHFQVSWLWRIHTAFKNRGKLAGLKQFVDNIASANKHAAHIKLRHRRPIAEQIQAVLQTRVRQYINAFIGDPQHAEHLHNLRRGAALRKNRRAVHKKNNFVIGNFNAYAIKDIGIVSHNAYLTPVAFPQTQEGAVLSVIVRNELPMCPCNAL